MASTFKGSIPRALFNDIVAHIRANCRRWAKRSWDSSRAEEDAVSSGFWGRFDEGDVSTGSYPDWRWKMEHRILGGRGKGSAESNIGADGIFEVSVFDKDGSLSFQKAFLFQAKMKDAFFPSTTLEQAETMEKYAPDASIILVYDSGEFSAVKSDNYIEKHKGREYSSVDVCDYIINEFFECNHGERGLSYDIENKVLTTPREQVRVRDLKEAVNLKIQNRG